MSENTLNYFWYNYQEQSYDIRDSLDIPNDEIARLYIPNTDFAFSLYKKYRLSGRNIKQAMREVLKIYKGIK